jgi:hypothetical protein
LIFILIFLIGLYVTAHSVLRLLRAYTASLWKVPLSRDTWDLLSERSPDTDEFLWTCNLLRLCPAAEKPNRKLAAVRFYYALLELFRGAARHFSPVLDEWILRERIACIHFIAVVLDQRIEKNKQLYKNLAANGKETHA